MSSEGAVANLLVLEASRGIDVEVHIAKYFVSDMGKICNVPLPYTDEGIVSCLDDFGFVAAGRQARHIFKEDCQDLYTPVRTVILTFRSNVKFPDAITLGFFRYEAR